MWTTFSLDVYPEILIKDGWSARHKACWMLDLSWSYHGSYSTYCHLKLPFYLSGKTAAVKLPQSICRRFSVFNIKASRSEAKVSLMKFLLHENLLSSLSRLLNISIDSEENTLCKQDGLKLVFRDAINLRLGDLSRKAIWKLLSWLDLSKWREVDTLNKLISSTTIDSLTTRYSKQLFKGNTLKSCG